MANASDPSIAVFDFNSLNPSVQKAPRQAYRRWPAVLLLSAFAGIQFWHWWESQRNWLFPNPVPVQGPLYFLANESPDDDWIGIVLLMIMIPCLLAYPWRPSRTTAMVCLLTVLAWLMPGLLMIWSGLP